MKKNILGLDIGSHSIKAVQISRDSKTASLLAAGYIATPHKASSMVQKKEEEIIAGSINRLIHDMKVSTTDVSASLSSSKVITRVIQVPLMDDKELESSISWEAEQFIPWPLSGVKIDYVVIERDQSSKTMKIQLVAAPTDLIEKYMRVIKIAGLNPVAIETEILAITRSINTSYSSLSNVVVVSIGASTTEIGLIHENVLIYTKSFPIGGDSFTRAIAQELGFEALQAEEYKKTYGLDQSKLEGKISAILTPFVTNIFRDIEKTVVYFRDTYPKQDLNTLVLCGGSAKLPGIVSTLTKNLGLDTQVSNPFVNIAVDPNILPVLTPDASIYTTSVGLALKEID